MTDVLTPAGRSAMMAKIRGKDTKPELAVRRLAHAMGYRFRLHEKRLPGTPDLVFRSRRRVIFVHGCFWHRHPRCSDATTPKSRKNFWLNKLNSNVMRDVRTKRALNRAGWKVLTVWECRTDNPGYLARRLERFLGPAK